MKEHLRSLAEIKAGLRAGDRPENLPGATYLDGGSMRDAYRVGPFVVKRSDAWAPAMQAKLPIRRAPTVRIKDEDGNSYDIQLKYDGIRYTEHQDRWESSPEHRKGFLTVGWDLHSGNVGIDHRGRFVAFDW